MELPAATNNSVQTFSLKNEIGQDDLFIPYQVQCALIRIFIELYPEGMMVKNFISDLLACPIFKPYIANIEQLMLKLSHIIKKRGKEIICLQPFNHLKLLKDAKFTAAEIYDIDELILENLEEYQKIAYKLEYRFINILEESVMRNIASLLDEQPDWILEKELCDLYNGKFGSELSHYRRWGFTNVGEMLSKLPELCHVDFSDEEVKIISVKNYMFDERNVSEGEEEEEEEEEDEDEEISVFELYPFAMKDKSEKKPDKNDGLLKQFLRDDPFLKASLNYCFLDEKIPNVELAVEESFKVHVYGVDSNLLPSIICQKSDESLELKNLLKDMKMFYTMFGSKFKFDSTLTMKTHVYAFFLNDGWHRGIAAHINFNDVQMINVDNGTVHFIPNDNVRILYKQFGVLPAQSFVCRLYDIKYVDETELCEIVDKDCTIYVTGINETDQSVNVKIKYRNSTSEYYLNDEWLANGVAVLNDLSDEEYED